MKMMTILTPGVILFAKQLQPFNSGCIIFVQELIFFFNIVYLPPDTISWVHNKSISGIALMFILSFCLHAPFKD